VGCNARKTNKQTISNNGTFWCPEMACSDMSLKTQRAVEKYNSKGYFNAKSEKRKQNLQGVSGK
jgi:hypothetical protein